MKILHVLDHGPPLQSGYVSRSLGIIRGQRARGWRTAHLISPRQQAGEAAEAAHGLLFHRTPAARSPLASVPVVGAYLAEMRATEARILEVARAERADLIQAHSPPLNGIPAIRAGRRLGIPVVYEVRAFWEDAAVDLGRQKEGDLRYRLTRALETHALRRADAVTTLCRGTRDDIVARGIPAGKVTIIPNAVDAARFVATRGTDDTLRRRFGLAGRKVLGFIGSFYRYEGLPLLLAALPRIVRAAPDVRLLLVGGGPEEALLAGQVAALGLGDHVVMPGRVPFAEIDGYYDLVDIFVYPRLRMRLTDLVTPLKPIEAMASGRIVIASDVGGHREIVADGQTGFLFPAGDRDALAATVLTVLRGEASWPEMAARARRHVEEERDWARVCARYEPVFAALTGLR